MNSHRIISSVSCSVALRRCAVVYFVYFNRRALIAARGGPTRPAFFSGGNTPSQSSSWGNTRVSIFTFILELPWPGWVCVGALRHWPCPGWRSRQLQACASAAACRWSDTRALRAAASSGPSVRFLDCGRTVCSTCTTWANWAASGTCTASCCRTSTPLDPFTGKKVSMLIRWKEMRPYMMSVKEKQLWQDVLCFLLSACQRENRLLWKC